MEKACKNCQHSVAFESANEDHDYPIFECRFNPPTVSDHMLERYGKAGSTEHAIYLATVYPVVCDDGLCSKWEER